MKKISKYLFLTLSIFVLSIGLVQAVDDRLPEKPVPPRLVNNFSKEFPDFLSQAEQMQLENKLTLFNDSTSNQITIVIVDDLQGYEANDYATRLGQKWGVGQGKFDNGIVILIKPTGGAGQRDLYIAVGYGLEGIIPDVTAKQIVRNEITPSFKNGNNYEGLDKATTVLMSLAKGEYNSDAYAKKHPNKPKSNPIIIIVMVLFLILFISSRRKNGGQSFGSRGGGFMGGMMGGMMTGGGGNWGGFSSGSGGFGGFGGGGFGGGGAGGKW